MCGIQRNRSMPGTRRSLSSCKAFSLLKFNLPSDKSLLRSLGGCLDKITGGLSDFIGNVGLKMNAIPLFIATATIFICLFSLYFGTPGGTRELGNHRALAWFMSQGLFLAPLLVSMQGKSNPLLANLGSADLNTSAIAQCLQFSVSAMVCSPLQ